MKFVLVRVDNRLVHGQILEAWVPYFKAECIVVADDNVAADFYRESVIRMAVPWGIDVLVYSIDEFARSHRFGDTKGKKAIVLFSSIHDAKKAFGSGFRYDILNIGNIYNENGLACSPSVFLASGDISELECLSQSGIRIEMRCVPRDKPVTYPDFMKKEKTVE